MARGPMAEQPSNSHPSKYTGRKVHSVDYLPALFLAAAIVFLPLGSESSPLNSLAIVFVSIVLEAIPFMLVGSLVGGFIEAFVSRLYMDIDTDEPTEKQKKLLKNLEEFEIYIRNNAGFIPNYGASYRYGEAITIAFVESTINQIVSKRMIKKQQMRWSQQGAHWLLQVLTRVLNDELRETIQ